MVLRVFSHKHIMLQISPVQCILKHVKSHSLMEIKNKSSTESGLSVLGSREPMVGFRVLRNKKILNVDLDLN